MTEIQQKPYDPIDTVARSIFVFALLAWLPMIVTFIMLILSPIPPTATFAQIRMIIIGGFGIATTVGFGIVVGSFRRQPADLVGISTIINRVLSKWWIAIPLILILLEINFVALLTLGNIAPIITNPAKFLLVCWTLLFFVILLTINWNNTQAWFTKTQGLWVSIGVLVVAFVMLSGLLFLTAQIINATGIVGRLQGRLDPRQLEFVDDGNMPTSQQFWAEQGQMTVRWLPYNYWTLAPYDGEFINVDSQGVRYTPSFTDDDNAQTVYFFGGSTMWGEGARDEYTIAGHVAKLLADNRQAQHVINYGQTGYVSRQDMILFQSQLAVDNMPDVALFYQGFNDVYAAYLQDVTGIPYRENQRVSDVEAGRLLRAGQPVFRLPDGDISSYDWSLVGESGASAEIVADRWFANVKQVQILADAYDIEVLFIWQPALFAKDSLNGEEARILADLEIANPNFIALYQAVDAIVQQRVVDKNLDNVLVLTDLFVDSDRAIFYDLVHITEIGNLDVANAILPNLIDFLEK